MSVLVYPANYIPYKSKFFITLMQKSYKYMKQSCSVICNIAHTSLIWPAIIKVGYHIINLWWLTLIMTHWQWYCLMVYIIISPNPTLYLLLYDCWQHNAQVMDFLCFEWNTAWETSRSVFIYQRRTVGIRAMSGGCFSVLLVLSSILL